jgi:hypothetical protein
MSETFDHWWKPTSYGLAEREAHEVTARAAFLAGQQSMAGPATSDPAAAPSNVHELLVGGIVRAAIELAILRGDLRMDNGASFDEMSDTEREDVITDTWQAINGEGTCDDTPVKELTAIYAALAAHPPTDPFRATRQLERSFLAAHNPPTDLLKELESLIARWRDTESNPPNKDTDDERWSNADEVEAILTRAKVSPQPAGESDGDAT